MNSLSLLYTHIISYASYMWYTGVNTTYNTVFVISFGGLYILKTSMAISGVLPTCDSAHSWWHFSLTSH